MTDPAIIEAVKWALQDNPGTAFQTYQELAEIAVAAALPLIRAAALEEAAMVADDEDGEYWYAGEHRNMVMLQQHGYDIAAAIRALKTSGQPIPKT